MEKTIKIISRVLLVLSLLFLPIMFIGGLFGLAGSDAEYFVIIWLGYTGLIVSTIICQFRYKFFPLSVVSIIAVIIGLSLDANFWKNENSNLCQELRANPTCVEDECGFTCSDFGGAGFVTGYGVCANKDPKLCVEKVAKTQKTEKETKNVLDVYSGIVDKIIASPNPTSENFENQLIAVYNCLESTYGSGAKGEMVAVQILTQKKLNEEQLQKYYDYLASKGRNINPSRIVAGLPNGDKSFSCDNLK